jgi:hypothetical protein
MAVAPPGWGAFGGHLIIAHSNGTVVAVNPSAPNAFTVVGTTTGNLSDLEFDNQTLYVAANSQNAVLTMSPTGSFSTFGNLSCAPDGVAVKENQFVYAACGSSNQIHKLAIPSGTPSLVTSAAQLNGGWAPAGLIFDGLNDLIVMEDGEFLKTYTP